MGARLSEHSLYNPCLVILFNFYLFGTIVTPAEGFLLVPSVQSWRLYQLWKAKHNKSWVSDQTCRTLPHNSDSDVCDVQTRMPCDNWRRFELRGPAPTASVWTPSRPRLPRTRTRQTLSTETSEGMFLTLHPGASYYKILLEEHYLSTTIDQVRSHTITSVKTAMIHSTITRMSYWWKQ